MKVCLVSMLFLFSTVAAKEHENDRIQDEIQAPHSKPGEYSFLRERNNKECSATGVETENLIVREANEQGFGDLDNKYSLAMASFGDFVYVGTLNAPGFPFDLPQWFLGLPLAFGSFGAKVYRGKTNGNGNKWKWEKVFDFGSDTVGTASNGNQNFGIRKMLVVENYLYFVTANHNGFGAEVWKSSDGENWSLENDPGFDIADNISGRSLRACGGYLYVGVENRESGAQIWRSKLNADGNIDQQWDLVEGIGFGNPNNYFVAELEMFGNSLYAGTINGFEGGELWKTDNCGAADAEDVEFNNVFDGGLPNLLPGIDLGFAALLNSGVLTIKTVRNSSGVPFMFIGLLNYVLGASLFVSVRFPFTGKIIGFVPVFLFGNGDIRQSYVWAMEEYEGRLYIGTFQRPGLLNFLDDGIELPTPSCEGGLSCDEDFTLFSLDLGQLGNPLLLASSLVTETLDGFGTCYPYGIRNMVEHDGKLVIGTAGAGKDGGTLVLDAQKKEK